MASGHSLGAGIASILGLQVANALPRLKSHSLYKTPPERPQVVLFGAPYVGNAEFSRQLKEKTIVRSITTTYDPVSFLPCKKGMPVCDAESVPVPTGETVKPLDAYADMPNVVMVRRICFFHENKRVALWLLSRVFCIKTFRAKKF